MPQHRLTARQVASLRTPGRHADGGNLYLQITPAGSRAWVLRYERDGRERWMGLGTLDLVPLAAAREKALAARRQLLEGLDPLALKQSKRSAAHLSKARLVTFEDAAEAYITSHKSGWKSPVSERQWRNALAAYAFPIFGTFPIADVDTAFVLKVVEPLWREKTETASRLRSRIELVLDWATARGHRQGENPARWKGHLDKLLPAKTAVAPVEHMAALPYAELPGFMVKLRERDSLAARAVEFTILTASRTAPVLHATPSQFDLAAATWTIPASVMKGRRGRERPHVVPLGRRSLEIVRDLIAASGPDEPIFPIGAGAMLRCVAALAPGTTTHGFRSAFRDWVANETNFQGEVAEAALAHTIKNQAEAAYRRGDLLEKRRRMMEAWSDFTTSPPTDSSNVVAIGARHG